MPSSITLYTDKVDQILTQTLYPAICRVADRTDLLQESFVKSNRLALMWGVPFGVGLALFAPDLVEFVLGDRWEPAVLLLQAFGLIAAVNHIGFNWSAYYRALGNTRPIAWVGGIFVAVYLTVAMPLLAIDGLEGLAIGMAIAAAAGLAARAYYVTRLFPHFHALAHSMRAIAPTIPAAGAVLGLRMLESGERTAGMAAVEFAVFVAVTLAATGLLERPLLREVLGYLRRGRAAAPA